MTCLGDRFLVSPSCARIASYVWLFQFFRASEPDPAGTALLILGGVSQERRQDNIVCGQ
jgi:hypothetical protein